MYWQRVEQPCVNLFTLLTGVELKMSSCVSLSKSVYYSLSEEPNEELEATRNRDTHAHSDGEQSEK